jgi:hypothetical protein
MSPRRIASSIACLMRFRSTWPVWSTSSTVHSGHVTRTSCICSMSFSLLRLGSLVQPSRSFFVWSSHNIIPQLYWGIRRLASGQGNGNSCCANLLKNQEIHCLRVSCSIALGQIGAGNMISRAVGCSPYRPSLLQDGRLAPKQVKE